MAFDPEVIAILSQTHYAPLGAQALGLSPDEVVRKFAPWCRTHFGGHPTRAAASDTWFHTVLIKAGAHDCASGDAIALDFLRFAKLCQATRRDATWMGTPWLNAIRGATAPPQKTSWTLAAGVGLGLFRWDWSTLEPREVRAQEIAPREVWIMIVANSGRVHELGAPLGRWLSAFPRLHAAVRETPKYRRACTDKTMLTQAHKLGFLVPRSSSTEIDPSTG